MSPRTGGPNFLFSIVVHNHDPRSLNSLFLARPHLAIWTPCRRGWFSALRNLRLIIGEQVQQRQPLKWHLKSTTFPLATHAGTRIHHQVCSSRSEKLRVHKTSFIHVKCCNLRRTKICATLLMISYFRTHSVQIYDSKKNLRTFYWRYQQFTCLSVSRLQLIHPAFPYFPESFHRNIGQA